MQDCKNPTRTPSGKISNEPGERRREEERGKRNAIYSGHLRVGKPKALCKEICKKKRLSAKSDGGVCIGHLLSTKLQIQILLLMITKKVMMMV